MLRNTNNVIQANLMTGIFLVRHGEAAASWGDHPDPGLSELGKAQAEAVARDLQALGARQALTSPMQRCRETARPFEQATGMSADVVSEVSEIATPEDVTDRVTWLQGFMAGSWDVEGAAHVDWRARMLDRLRLVPDGTAVFTHFVAINAIVSALQCSSSTVVFRPGHCSVTTLSTTGGVLKLQELGSESATRVL